MSGEVTIALERAASLGPLVWIMAACAAAACVMLYLLPSVAAIARHAPRPRLVVAINVLLGWTGVAWLWCLWWAADKGHGNGTA